MQPTKTLSRITKGTSKRYPFYGDNFVNCALVYENGHWFVEKGGSGGETVRLSLREFEQSATGRRLAAPLAFAITHAQEDL
jgi:hypothetical protein